MRTKTMLLSAAVMVLAVVVGLLGALGTWALWNASVQSDPGTVQAATFDIRLNNAPMGATAIAAPETTGALLTPGAPVYATVKIENATNASTPMTVAAVMNPPQVVNASHAGLAASLIVRAAEAPSSGTCADAKYTQSNTSATTTIDQSKTGRFCLRMSLAAAVPPELGRTPATATITTTVTVTQQPRGT